MAHSPAQPPFVLRKQRSLCPIHRSFIAMSGPRVRAVHSDSISTIPQISGTASGLMAWCYRNSVGNLAEAKMSGPPAMKSLSDFSILQADFLCPTRVFILLDMSLCILPISYIHEAHPCKFKDGLSGLCNHALEYGDRSVFRPSATEPPRSIWGRPRHQSRPNIPARKVRLLD